jgi:hypothetical protein
MSNFEVILYNRGKFADLHRIGKNKQLFTVAEDVKEISRKSLPIYGWKSGDCESNVGKLFFLWNDREKGDKTNPRRYIVGEYFFTTMKDMKEYLKSKGWKLSKDCFMETA